MIDIGNTYKSGLVDYEAHLQMLFIYHFGELHAGITNNMLDRIGNILLDYQMHHFMNSLELNILVELMIVLPYAFVTVFLSVATYDAMTSRVN